ncbi:MAG: HEAT repeat domain-containing protein, partial [Akkermansiaceae bacterium]|nr:HEAT repeat domain-containing protein [Akkermansiaceae bacterium]
EAALKSAHDSATSNEARLIFIELLGAAGGDTASEVVTEALKNEDNKTRLAAVAALGNWADDTEFETLLDYVAEENNDTLRKRAFDAAFQFLKIDRPRDEIDLEDMWKMLAREAQTQTEKMKIVTGLASLVDDWAFAVVEFFVEDDDDKVSFRAEKALEHMEDRRKRVNPDEKDEDDEPDDSGNEEEETPEE